MTILITGATGNVGRHIVAQLLQTNQHVRALTRNPAQANLPTEVEIIAGDLATPATFAQALQGVSALHLINFDGTTGEPLQSGAEIIERARQAGVERITVLLGGEKGALEQAVEASGLEWTMLQPVEFMNGALDWSESIRSEGVVRVPFAERRTAAIHEADIGAVAAAVLVRGGYAGQTLTLTGPEVLTPRVMVRTIGAAIEREIEFVELSEAQALADWQAAGHSDELIGFMLWVYGNTPPEGYTVVPTVERVTGRRARSFALWAAEHADAFRS